MRDPYICVAHPRVPSTARPRPAATGVRKRRAALAWPDMETDRPRTRGAVRRAVWILSLAVLFGVASAWIKGNDAGLRDAIGNASAPWLLLPFLAGAAWRSRRLSGAAMAGLAATLAALAGFYFADSFVLQLGPHPWLVDLSLTMRGAIFWAERVVVTGPAFGALGFWWHRHRSPLAAGLAAAAFVLEPAAWWLYGRYLGGGAAYPVPAYPALWLTEIAVGVTGLALLSRQARHDQRAA